MQDIEPDKLHGKRKPGIMSRTWSAHLQSPVSVKGIGEEDACYRTIKISPVERFICLKLAKIIFLSEFAAEYMFTPFSQVKYSDSKLVRRVGKGGEFSTNHHWNRTSGSDFSTNQHCR